MHMKKIIVIGSFTFLVLALATIESLVISNNNSKMEDLNSKIDLLNARMNSLERMNAKYFELEQEEKEELVSIVKVRSIIP